VLSGVIVGYESRPKYDQRPFPATLQAVREHAMNRVEERARQFELRIRVYATVQRGFGIRRQHQSSYG
jgi:hypothetical protein